MIFNDIPRNKQTAIDKISIYVKLYAKFHKVAKYIHVVKLNDPINVYDGILLDKTKLFLHTSYFKKYKTEHSMLDRDGNNTENFFSCRDSWFEDHHLEYMVAENTMYKVFNNALEVTMNDFVFINSLYRELQIEYRKSK